MSIELTLLSRVRYRGAELTGSRLIGLLALLAADPRTGCGTTRLVDALWPDEQPEHPTKALQVLVSRARARLGADAIASTPLGYRLTLPEDGVDASAVLINAATSQGYARDGAHADALAQAEAGLDLCAGAETWAGGADEDDPLAQLRAARVSTYRSLTRSRALALARLGRRTEALGPLVEEIERDPRDEEVLAELLRCEAAIKGPATALARYDAYRRGLRDELGGDPGPALRAVHADLLRDDTPTVRHGVRYEPNPLLGRDHDVAEVTTLLRSARVTSIVGAGGLGKTRLAHVVSRAVEARAVHFVGLAGVTTDADVLGEVASVLGIGEPGRAAVGRIAVPANVLGGIVAALGPGPALLVLDNCEHVVRGAAELVQALVSMSRDLRVLTTSRAPLGLSSEFVYLLPELSTDVAVELFEQRARAARPGVDLPEATVRELCAHLDGLPLAVELAAARVRVMSVVDIARRIDDRFSLLRGGARDAPQRHRTLHAVIEWSWQLLEADAQAALRTLSVFPDGFSVDAARHTVHTDGDVLLILEQLVDQSLLKVVDTETGARFRMLETVREFTAARRDEAGDTAAVLERFLGWATDFGKARPDSVFSQNLAGFVQDTRTEQDNLIQALRTGLDRADGAPIVAATSAALSGLWMVESNFARIAGLATETGQVLAGYHPELDMLEVTRTALVLCAIGAFLVQGQQPPRLYAALRAFPPAPPDTVIRAAQFVLNAVSDDYETLSALCDSDEPLIAGMASAVASYGFEAENDLDGALAAARRMVSVFDEHGSTVMRAVAHSRVGELSLQADPGEPALAHLNIAMATVEKLGAWITVARGRWAIVLANLQSGALVETERMLGEALRLGEDEEVGLDGFDTVVRATISIVRGDVDEGLRGWREAAHAVRGRQAELGPWPLEIQSVCVVAHAQHHQLDQVTDLMATLPEVATGMIGGQRIRPAAFPACGAALLALAMIDLDRAPTLAARLIALAERLRYLRGFHPIMSIDVARRAARDADGPAYDDAVSSYAGLDHAGQRAEIFALLSEHTRLSGSDPA
ncbi:MAG TPA: BTAD domain-containing putative transcriptional regulator [Pseudonocardiaceae bacterium]|nr:BTAD domain-containing putative transcriptional regulator [Pseudonocardiaceae bacterium]